MGTKFTGKWTQLKGKVKEKWGKLTDDDLDIAAGKHKHHYGFSKEQAKKYSMSLLAQGVAFLAYGPV